MPPRGAQSSAAAKLVSAGNRAAERAQKEHGENVRLTCDYLGVPDGAGGFDSTGRTRKETEVAFEWRCSCPGMADEHFVVVLRCDNAMARGVSFPDGWRIAIRSLSLDEIAKASARPKLPPIGVALLPKMSMQGSPDRAQSGHRGHILHPYRFGSTVSTITRKANKQHKGSFPVMDRRRSYSGKSISAMSAGSAGRRLGTSEPIHGPKTAAELLVMPGSLRR